MLVFFDRTLYMSLSMHWGTCSAQTPTEKDSCGDQCAAQTDSHSAYDISSAPQSSDCLGRRISGKAPTTDTGGGFTRKHDRRARTTNSLASWTDKDVCQRPCTITLSPQLSALKKLWSPTCPLNGSFQSPNCPLKGFFHLPNGIF